MTGLATNLLESLADQADTHSPEWLSELRQRGREQFKSTGLPGKRVEEWKYTSLLSLESQASGLGHAVASDAAYSPEPISSGIPRISMLDGEFHAIDGELPAGVRVQSLRTLLTERPDDVREQLQSLEFSQARDGFSALNTANLNPGLLIRVDAQTEAGDILLQWNAGESEASALFNTRVLIILEPGASLHLVEQIENRVEDTSILNQVVQCGLGENARLSHTRLQKLSATSAFISRIAASQAAGSAYGFTALDIGTGLVRHDVKASLNGEAASCEMNGAVVAGASSHTDHHLEAAHIAGNCESSQLFRAVAQERGRVVFNGKVYVHEGADGTEAQQSSAGLLLSRLAEIDAKPELEIYADEVIASHGATVGQLDEKAVFYLQTRGLDKTEARRILTMAFCRSVADKVSNPALRETLGMRLSNALSEGMADD